MIDVSLGFFDLILIAFVEIVFIWFFFPKEFVGKVVTMVGAINLIKIGSMSMIYPIIPSLATTINQILLVEVTMIFIIGIIASTMIYEKEKWAPDREYAGALAFRITALSSLVWVMYKSIAPNLELNLDFLFETGMRYPTGPSREAASQSLNSNDILPYIIPIEYFGLILFLIGFTIFLIRYKSSDIKAKVQKKLSSNM